jgi:hypothetical protein
MDKSNRPDHVTGFGFDSPGLGIGEVVYHKGNGQRGVVASLTYNPALMYGVAYAPGMVVECSPQELQATPPFDDHWQEGGDCEADR